MGRSLLRTLLALFVLLAGILVPVTVQAPIKNGTSEISTDKTDYFIGEVVQANFVIEWTGGSPSSPVTFEWYTPASALIFNETLDAISYDIGPKHYLGAFSNWTSNMTGNGFRVKGFHNDHYNATNEFAESYFNVSLYSDAVYVNNLTLTLNSNFYENGTTAKATANLTFLGNGIHLDNVSFMWNYPNGSEAFNENKTPTSAVINGSVEVYSFWTIDFEGTNFEVVASYQGVAPLSDTAYFDVIPIRVITWKNKTTGNDVWDPGEGPFGVCDNITIDLGDSLRIPAGSTVRFCLDTGITVRGTLKMEGFPTSNITLTSYSYPANRGDWKGVSFEDSGSDSSVLNNVKVNFSQQGVAFFRASPNLANITIANSSFTGIDAFQTTISLSGIVIIDSGRGIFALETTLDLMDSEILRCDDGVVVDGSDGTFERNQIFAISGSGIWASSSSLTIRNSMILAVDNGLRIERSRDFLVEGSTINSYSDTTFAFWTSRSTNLTFSRDTISTGVLSFSTTDETLVVNSTITSSPENFRVWGGSTVTTLNCSFDDTLVSVSSGSWLYVQNFLDVHVFDTNSLPLAGASVELILDQAPILPKYTDSGGWVRWQILLYETFSGPGNPTYTSNQVNVTLDGYNITNNFRTLDMSISHTEDFEGYPAFVPPDYGDGDQFVQLMMIGIILPIIVVLLAIMILLWLKRRKKQEEPAEEVSEPFEFEPQEGMGYIFVNDGRDRSFQTLMSEMEKGSLVLCFTRTFPPTLKKQYELEDAKILWLSRDEGKGGFIPTNLGAISNVVEKFLKENKENRNIVLIDGLEYLMAQNGFSKVLKLVHNLNDMVGVSSGSLIIPFNLKSVEGRQAALLSGDLEVVE